MAHPSIAGTVVVGNDTANTTSHVITLPSSMVVGELVTVVLAMDGNTTFTWPAGWTHAPFTITNSPSDGTLEARCRIVDGTEGSTITVTTGASEGGSWLAFRVTGWHGTTMPEAGTPAVGSGTLPDPSSVTPSWGNAENLFIVLMGWGTSVSSISTYPSNYTLNQNTDALSNAAVAGIAMAARQLTASTDDPGTATLSNTTTWVAVTMVVRPAAAGGTSILRQMLAHHGG